MLQNNPFLTEGYLSPEYFCDRVEETALLTRHLTNGCNVALIAPRRMGYALHACHIRINHHHRGCEKRYDSHLVTPSVRV